MSNELGITIPIPQALTSQLKRSSTREDEFQNRGRFLQQVEGAWKQQEDEEKDESICTSHVSDVSANNEIKDKDSIIDDDRAIMPFVRPESVCKGNSGETLSDDSDNDFDVTEEMKDNASIFDDDDDDDDDNDNDSDDTDSDQVSLSPPSCMPVLAVDLEQLCGYKPSDNDDIKRLTDDLCETLLGSKADDLLEKHSQDDRGHEKQSVIAGDINCVHFIERCTELFESGIAYHSDTSSSQKQIDNTTAIVPYPEFLPLTQRSQEDQDEKSQLSLLSTSKIWKEIIHPHNIPVVQRLLVLLSKCSRSLLWKYQMSSELRYLAKSEQKFNTERIRRKSLSTWRNETRPTELAKLYEVRETFEHKIEFSREKYDQIMRDKEDRVQSELRRRKEEGIGMGGIAGLDWGGNETFAVDGDAAIADSCLNDEDCDYSSRGQLSEKDDGNDMLGYEHDADLSASESSQCDEDDISYGEPLPVSIPPMMPKQTISTFERKKRRAAAASKRMRKKLESEKESARMLALRQRIKAAHEEEEEMRKICSTTEENLALAVVTNLEKKLEKIDSLLETMQEEEWKDQEEGVMLSEGLSDVEEASLQEGSSMSLLDQILAMILGAFPPLDTPVKVHFANLKKEHQEIKNSWKITFGRLPVSSENTCYVNESQA